MLRTLKNVKSINGYDVVDMDELKIKYPDKFNKDTGAMDYKWFEKEIRPRHFIYVRHDVNSISFTIQDGPVLDKGINGCQVDTVIALAKKVLEELQEQLPCRENAVAITKLDEALLWLMKRTLDRTERNVEGTQIH